MLMFCSILCTYIKYCKASTQSKLSRFTRILTCVILWEVAFIVCCSLSIIFSDVVLETKVLVSRRLEDKNTSLGLGLGLETQSLGLGLEISLGLDLGLDKKVLSIFKPFLSLLMTENYDIVV